MPVRSCPLVSTIVPGSSFLSIGRSTLPAQHVSTPAAWNAPFSSVSHGHTQPSSGNEIGNRQAELQRRNHNTRQAKAGVPVANKRHQIHALRHTAVSLLEEAGIPAAVVMELIGHDSEEMSQHYTMLERRL